MTWQSAEQIADALLYEGYLLYPYRGSAVKNRYRWQFGIVAPRVYSDAEGSERCLMRTECLVEPDGAALLDVKVRFLHVQARQVEVREAREDGTELWRAVDSTTVDGRELLTWDEAAPHELVIADVPVSAAATQELRTFEIPGDRAMEAVHDVAGTPVARLVRERSAISCVVRVAVEPIGARRKVSVRIENVTPWPEAAHAARPAALRRSLVAAHTLLAVRKGAFVSLLEPPAGAAADAAACQNVHTWPVLVGTAPQRNLMLSSPIILYDYPAIAPESPGDSFDGTEIDELLALRVRTLTTDERRQALATDVRAQQVIERATAMATPEFERLHGAIRYFGAAPQPAHIETAALEAWLNPPGSDVQEAVDSLGNCICKGARVRLRPAGGADAMDMFLTDQTATVAAVYSDVDEQTHVAVIVDAGDAADLHESNGRFFYFRPDEVEVLQAEAAPQTQRARVLVAGIGNMFLGDDGFGSAVAERLATCALPEWVRVEDFGIRSVHLAYNLLDASYETTVLIDALPRGGAPGTLYLVEPEVEAIGAEPHDAHSLSVEGVIGMLKQIGGEPGRILIVGCEPLSTAPEMGLSDAVANAVDGAVDMVMDLLATVKV